MAQTAPTPVDAAPAAPSRQSPTTFAARADAWVAWQEGAVAKFNALGSNAYDNAVDCWGNAVAAQGSATAATASKIAAAASASDAIAAVGAPAWASGTAYALGAAVYSSATRLVYRRIVAGAGTTDPSVDAANWAPSSAANALALQMTKLGVI